MRRRTNGVLLPGVLLTVLASIGVGALLAAGVPVLPQGLPTLPSSDRNPERRMVEVSPSESPRPRPPSPAPTTPPAPPTTGGTGGTGGSGGTAGPTTPAGSRSPSPATGPGRTAPPGRTPPSKPAAPSRTAQPMPTRSIAAAPPCKPGSTVVHAVADAYVDQGSPGQTFHGPSLFVASRDKDRNRRALVRFAVPSLPKGCSLRAATLTMTAKEPTGRRLLVARAGSRWSESSVTWANAPRPAGAAAAATLSGTTVSWNVTGQVAAGAAYGFVVYDAAEGSTGNATQANLNGRDSRTPPALTLRWG